MPAVLAGAYCEPVPRDPGHTDRLVRRLRWEELDPAWLERLAGLAREEDLEGGGLLRRPARVGDPTSELLARSGRASARLVARGPVVVAGLGMIAPVLAAYGKACVGRAVLRDGARAARGDVLGVIEGPAPELLQAERPLLNFIQRLCGVATWTRRHVDAMGATPSLLLDTRKTTPGFRMLEKYAVGVGGGHNHRLGLFDRVMVKDNHLAAADGSDPGARILELVRRARAARPDLLIEVEVDRPDQIGPALASGAEVILLDNFPLASLREAVPFVRGRAWCEVSGGVSLATLPELGALGPDFISCGALTHAAPWADIGLDWD